MNRRLGWREVLSSQGHGDMGTRYTWYRRGPNLTSIRCCEMAAWPLILGHGEPHRGNPTGRIHFLGLQPLLLPVRTCFRIARLQQRIVFKDPVSLEFSGPRDSKATFLRSCTLPNDKVFSGLHFSIETLGLRISNPK